MKRTIILIAVCLACSVAQAQSVKLKKGNVFVDDQVCMTYDADMKSATFKTPDGGQTVVLKFIRTGVGENDGLYTKVVFVEQGKSLTTRDYTFTKKLLIKSLVSKELLKDCVFDPSKIDLFIEQYDERVEENLTRY
jgi:hypothetical protein